MTSMAGLGWTQAIAPCFVRSGASPEQSRVTLLFFAASVVAAERPSVIASIVAGLEEHVCRPSAQPHRL